jgi:hypothetical protein
MKSKIKSPEFVATLKSGAYRTRLKAELALLAKFEEPQKFLLSLDHKFSDSTELLLVVNYSTAWKEFKKTNKASTDYASGHCELADGKISLSIERGKARDTAIITAFKKHPVLKHYELELELNNTDTAGVEELDGINNIKVPENLNEDENVLLFNDIKTNLAALKASKDFDKIIAIFEVLKPLVEKLHKLSDPNAPTQIRNIATQIGNIKQLITIKKESIGYKLIDHFVKYRNLLQNNLIGHENDLLTKFETLFSQIETWTAAEKNNDEARIKKQLVHLAAIFKNKDSFIQKIEEQQANSIGKIPIAGSKKTTVPTVTGFLTKAELSLDENDAELNDIIEKMEELEDEYNGGPSLRDRMEDIVATGVKDYDEFKAIYDVRMQKLDIIKQMLRLFLKNNQSIFSLVKPAQKKRVTAFNTLCANIEQEIRNSQGFFIKAKAAVTSITASIKDKDMSDTLEAMAMLSGDTSLDTFALIKIIADDGHKTLGSGLDKFKKLMSNGVFNVGSKDKKLLTLYNALGKTPIQQDLDLMFAPQSEAQLLVEDIATLLEKDYNNNAALIFSGSSTHIGVISNSKEVKELLKMFKSVENASLEDIGVLDVRYKEILAFAQQEKAKLAKMPAKHPQFELTSTEIEVLELSLLQYNVVQSVKIGARNNALAAVAALKNIKDSELIEMLIKDSSSSLVKAFDAFIKSRTDYENIAALRVLHLNSRPDVLLKDFIRPDSPTAVNIRETVFDSIISQANGLDKPLVPYTQTTISAIPIKTLKGILAPDTDLAESLKKQILTNLSANISAFKKQTATELYSFLHLFAK